jgi:hypothetical protein
MAEDEGLKAAWSCHAQDAERHFRESRQGKSGSMGKDGVRRGERMVSPLTAVGFGRILECLDVIRHRNNREKDQ